MSGWPRCLALDRVFLGSAGQGRRQPVGVDLLQTILFHGLQAVMEAGQFGFDLEDGGVQVRRDGGCLSAH